MEHEGAATRASDGGGVGGEAAEGGASREAEASMAGRVNEGGAGGPTALAEDGDGSTTVETESAPEVTKDDGELEEARTQLRAREEELASASRKLTELRTEVKTLRAFAAGQVAAAREELPETLLAFDPGDEAGLEARLAWLATAREQAGKMSRAPAQGAGEDPAPAGVTSREIPSPVALRNMF